MAYKIVYKESIEKDLKGLSRGIKAKILDHIEGDLSIDPQGKGNLKEIGKDSGDMRCNHIGLSMQFLKKKAR